MKISRKLIPAVAFMLVAAVLITTATFAWFSMNSRVTATGMQMETEAGDNVLIADTAEMAKVSSANFKNSLKLSLDVPYNLRPVSSINGVNFYYVKGFQVGVNIG